MAGLLSALQEVSSQAAPMSWEQVQTGPVSTAGGAMAAHLSSSVEARGVAVVHPVGVAQLADHQQVHTGSGPVHGGARVVHGEELKHKETEELKHLDELKHKQAEEFKQQKQMDGLETKQAPSGLDTKQAPSGLETKQAPPN
jgi:hypothetical protein